MSANFYVGVTDSRWFHYLASRQPDEVNFWIPSPKIGFKALREGGLFLFKLHYPENFVVGGGFFVRYTRLPLALAWNAFGNKNGVESQHDFLTALRRFRRDAHPTQNIGCVILASPFFFTREQWIAAPASWSKNIVRGKGYATASDEGAALLQAVRERLPIANETDELLDGDNPDRPLRVIRSRLGQGAFRALVTDAYTRRCAISGERTLPALEAAHIKPYAESGPNRTENGLLLRSDLHRLFDSGYLTVTPERRIEVSRRIREEFENGRDYYRHQGAQLAVEPRNPAEKPDSGYLGWHNENVFRP